MSKELDILSSFGCNTAVALARCVDDEEFYLDCVHESLSDPAFEALGTHLNNHRANSAFEAAHTLKGLLANMELAPLTKLVVQIVEPLRVMRTTGDTPTPDMCNQIDELLPIYQELLSTRDEIRGQLGC